jgi:transposase
MAVSPDLLNIPSLQTLSITPVGAPPTHHLVSARVVDTVRPQTCARENCCRRLESAGPRLLNLRDTPHGGLPAKLELSYRRWRCAKRTRGDGSVVHDPLPMIEPGHRITTRLARYVERLSLRHGFAEIARLTGIDERQIAEIVYRASRAAAELLPSEAPPILGIDEVHIAGRACLVLTDISRRRIIGLASSRSKATVLQEILKLGNWSAVRAATTDMCDAYADAVREVCPGAVIILDKRHVIDLVRTSMEDVRHVVRRSLPRGQQKLLKHDHVIFNKRRFKLSVSQKLRLQDWAARFPKLAAAYTLKEELFDIFNRNWSRAEAEAAFDAWHASIPADLVEAFASAVAAICKRRDGVFAYFDHYIEDFDPAVSSVDAEKHKRRVTNAYTEAANGLIKRVYREAHGFGKRFSVDADDAQAEAAFERFRVLILWKYGNHHLVEPARLRELTKTDKVAQRTNMAKQLAIRATAPVRVTGRRRHPNPSQLVLSLAA